jgi:hypothetical protein
MAALSIVYQSNFVRYTVTILLVTLLWNRPDRFVSYFGTNNAATYGDYYLDLTQNLRWIKLELLHLHYNVKLKISTLSSYDTFQWYFNDVAIPGAISNEYQPAQPGYYQVQGSIVGSKYRSYFSDKIPVSSCPTQIMWN